MRIDHRFAQVALSDAEALFHSIIEEAVRRGSLLAEDHEAYERLISPLTLGRSDPIFGFYPTRDMPIQLFDEYSWHIYNTAFQFVTSDEARKWHGKKVGHRLLMRFMEATRREDAREEDLEALLSYFTDVNLIANPKVTLKGEDLSLSFNPIGVAGSAPPLKKKYGLAQEYVENTVRALFERAEIPLLKSKAGFYRR